LIKTAGHVAIEKFQFSHGYAKAAYSTSF